MNKIIQKFVQFKSKYGKTGLALYFGFSALSFGSSYYMVKQNKETLTYYLNKIGLHNEKMLNSSDILIAYLAHKTTIPLRIGATAALTPIVKKMIL
ncbi:transmembrane protein, putative (macronuclear) [Tetrahymena thermophila SB210]|uniref:Transmembrane protein, putative n=1 Tax=Tetrahymena thermophila (strain SB210) TaxID=312017 RepID=I7M037_TETTS|nr:transmembrane protein, putative [Tetrahymena thermophila SB210]EAR85422.2 transmembrane protein, putative [Tetrahymena thermophila SB210]|eukprot:XP_001033085.2 transmembrane protein, putative [Tetrahymena thermophila SB210]